MSDMHDVPRDGATLGEIIARGNVVMRGYYNDPEATAAAFAGGWFHSGDAAVIHPDGYVEVRDRYKDVIISGGENISSIEVEGALLRHPAVLEVAVVGMPHEKWGEAPHAFIVLRPEVEVTEAELHDFSRGSARALQGSARLSFRERAAEDRDRKDPEVRVARAAAGHRTAVSGSGRAKYPDRVSLTWCSTCRAVRIELGCFDRLQMARAQFATPQHHHQLAPIVDEVLRSLGADPPTMVGFSAPSIASSSRWARVRYQA